MTEDITVRLMEPTEIDIRINYFHDAPDDYLQMMGADRTRFPSRETWREIYLTDFSRPLSERAYLHLIWEHGGSVVGFSNVDRIVYGQEAFMHAHMLNAAERGNGLGVQFFKASARMYIRCLELERLFGEPNALNTAPNRTLQRAGFHFVFTHYTTPGLFHFPQYVTRWTIDRDEVGDLEQAHAESWDTRRSSGVFVTLRDDWDYVAE